MLSYLLQLPSYLLKSAELSATECELPVSATECRVICYRMPSYLLQNAKLSATECRVICLKVPSYLLKSAELSATSAELSATEC